MNKTKLAEVIDQDGDTDNSIKDLTEIALPYLLHAFHKGIEGLEAVRISLQSTGDGTYFGSLSAVTDSGSPDERGFIAYTRGDTVGDVLEYFEFGLAYDELDWRADKYHKNGNSGPKKSRQGKVKRKLL